MDNRYCLYHYGVKGMKWKKRKKPTPLHKQLNTTPENAYRISVANTLMGNAYNGLNTEVYTHNRSYVLKYKNFIDKILKVTGIKETGIKTKVPITRVHGDVKLKK